MSYCVYYQAEVKKKDVWFFVATLRSFEHLAFDRTCDVEASVFEFFVPADLEDFFITCLLAYQARAIVVWFEKKPNRLAEPGAVF